MMSSQLDQEINIKRVSRKRSRDALRSHFTPAKKRHSSSPTAKEHSSSLQEQDVGQTESGYMADAQHNEYCSDDEDLFGDYDSIACDTSFLAKLDDIELNFEQRSSTPVLNTAENECAKTRGQHSDIKQQLVHLETDLNTLKTTENCNDLKRPSHKEICEGNSSADDFFAELPSSQLAFQQENHKAAMKPRSMSSAKGEHRESDNSSVCYTSSALRRDDGPIVLQNKSEMKIRNPALQRRVSLRDQLKKAMLGNALVQSPQVSRMKEQKQTVVDEEINVALQAMEPSSAIDLGPFFGLPSKVKDLIYRLRGIKDLYEWQQTCLTLDSVQQRRNLIYSLPTSGGKTLVAEILILRELLCRKNDALLILPYISLVQEKVRGLASFGLELDFLVEEYAGSKGRFPPVKRRVKKSLYIATIEKAHSLVNSLIETNRLDNLGLVVVDELHMLGDGSRGAILEMTLAKVLYVSKTTQIVGMSATLSNVGDLQKFLHADNYTNDFRPVQLKEYVKLQDCIYEIDPKEEECFKFSRQLNFKYSSSMQKMDPDHLIALVTEVIPAHSCLVFCPTKKNCENVAEMICKYLKKSFMQHKEKEKVNLLNELKSTGNGTICPVLKKTVPYGIAYHHSGLTSDERKLIEETYASGALCLLTCTSTLAAGINLPARSQYKQMTGRAGRAGIDTSGESILILQEKDKLLAKELVSRSMENCYSNLMHDSGRGILSLILSLIGLSITRTLGEIRDFVSCTLFSVQEKQICGEKSLWDIVSESLDILTKKGLVKSTAGEEETLLEVTKLGRATFKGSVDLTYCDVLYRDLSRGLEGLMLNSLLHLIYLVTPYEMVMQCKPDWMMYFRQFTQLTAAEQKMASAVGVPESFIAKKASGQSMKKAVDNVAVNRLYLSFVLFAMLKETNLWTVAEKFSLTRGFVQSLLSSSSAFCSCVLHFTEELEEFWAYKALLTELTKRLTYCVKIELIPLMEVAGVLEARAKQLYGAGYKTLAHLANADPNLLIKAIENLSKRQANQIVASAKMLLTEKAEALQEEVDELLTLPHDLPSL
ncbi:helicase POLQ-like isoform X2 [Lepisosteus oculatus]|uniref:helicase POLQ-like isoform X2 n=1 Tax=Lepisosteus oculatus TaxID=7918 RepID=UPI000740114C|nr:PREDICTED: helicase POLQ-like isoform X2 [Lepisosteus oculatus]